MEIEMVVNPPSTDSDPPPPSSKKSKRQQTEDEVKNAIQTSEAVVDMQEDPSETEWNQQSYADMFKKHITRPTLYLGEDDERDFDEFESMCEVELEGEPGKETRSLVVPISPEKYHSLF